jgi:hypothetical protein
MADAVGGAAKANGHANGYPSAYAAKYNLASHFIGGNELSNAPPSKVKDFVAAHDGHTVITNVSTQARKLRNPRLRRSTHASRNKHLRECVDF